MDIRTDNLFLITWKRGTLSTTAKVSRKILNCVRDMCTTSKQYRFIGETSYSGKYFFIYRVDRKVGAKWEVMGFDEVYPLYVKAGSPECIEIQTEHGYDTHDTFPLN